MNELALFAGAGGGILGGHLLGWRTVCAVEWEPYAAGVLLARQNDGILPPFPVWDDVRTFDGRAWRGIVDVVSGGFPCQDISCAGKGAGIDGERSGMWVEMARIIGEVGPRFVLVENSPMLTLRGLGRVLSDLVALGYDARWGVLGADDAGAPHVRKRIWIVGELDDAKRVGRPARGHDHGEHDGDFVGAADQDAVEVADADAGRCAQCDAGQWGLSKPDAGGETISDADEAGCEQQRRAEPDGSEQFAPERGGWWGAEPGVGRVADGVAARVDRLAALGNGQVPSVAALAWRVLAEETLRQGEGEMGR